MTLVLGVLWLGSNCRIISSDSEAVVMQFGRIVKTQHAGLLLAWPRPIEEVRLLPGPDRQLSRSVAALPALPGLTPPSQDNGDTVPAAATPYLTGDGKVVLLDATLIFHITDPAAYVLSQQHVAPAIDRIFRASAVQVAAGQALNDFLVFQSGGDQSSAGQSIDAVRRRVARPPARQHQSPPQVRLGHDQGDGLGVEIDRIDAIDRLAAARSQAGLRRSVDRQPDR